MKTNEFLNRVLECRERSFYADETYTMVFKRNPLYPMSWGLNGLKFLPSKDYPDEHQGIIFNVTGLLFKGAVLITLAWNDTFTVRFFETKDGNSIDERTDLQENEVYVDRLLLTIDEIVETKEDMQWMVK